MCEQFFRSLSKELSENGWYEYAVDDMNKLDQELIDVGRSVGSPVASRKSRGVVQELIPIISQDAHPNSLSAQYDLDSFPLHVDTSHWLIPCRYIIMGCLEEGESERETILLDFSKVDLLKTESNALLSAPFRVRNGRNTFYSTVLNNSRNFVRYDPGCMDPIDDRGLEAMRILSHEKRFEEVIHIKWRKGKILMIDNWRMLHGRGKSIKNGKERVLRRVLVQ